MGRLKRVVGPGPSPLLYSGGALKEACLPMLAELAPWGRKSGILAWQGALEGALGCLVTSSMEAPCRHSFALCFFRQTSRFPPARSRASATKIFPGCGASRVRP